MKPGNPVRKASCATLPSLEKSPRKEYAAAPFLLAMRLGRDLRVCALAALALAALAMPADAAKPPKKPKKPKYEVGLASRSINPDPDGTFDGERVYLGGYGIGGGGLVGDQIGGRHATGILGEGPSVRAFTVTDDEGNTFAIADIETQGWFAATKNGPYGLIDMRKAVEAATEGALPAESVVIQTDHSHGGADSIGVWGGVPDAYMEFMKNQTVDAIVEAFETRQRGTLWYGTAPGRDLLSNQFDYDKANEVVDSDVRVLQARDGEGVPFATMLNFSAHSTVLGSGNTHITGDWPQRANPMMEQRFGGKAMTVVATLGRTQPADRGCHDGTLTGDDRELCTLDDYAGRVVDRAAEAIANAEELKGDPIVAARSYLVEDVSSNAILLGALYAGSGIGVPINRAMTPPWLAGNVLGSITASARIGDILMSSGPGEMYPQITLKVADTVPARGHMVAGLANDQLGYLIAPYEAYPEPVKRSFFERGDEVVPVGAPSPIDNDNYFFNVSHTMGERVTCSLLRGAGEVFDAGSTYRDSYERCLTFPNDLALEHGSDVALSDLPNPDLTP
jgi:hypothetical protein